MVVVVIVAVDQPGRYAARERRPLAGRRLRAVHDPVAQRDAHAVDQRGRRHRVRAAACRVPQLLPGTADRRRLSGGFSVDRAVAAAVRRARQVVAPHVVRQRDVASADVPTQEVVIFSANTSAPPKVSTIFGQVSAGACSGRGCRAWAGRARCRARESTTADLRCPSGRAPARRRAAPAGVVGHAPARDQRPGALVHDAAGLVLVHAEEDVVPREVARLRRAADDRPVDSCRRADSPCRSRPPLRSWKNEPTSRNAAVPAPSTYGSFTV